MQPPARAPPALSSPSSPPQARDPIPQLKEFMLKNGLATEADIKEIHDKVGGRGGSDPRARPLTAHAPRGGAPLSAPVAAGRRPARAAPAAHGPGRASPAPDHHTTPNRHPKPRFFRQVMAEVEDSVKFADESPKPEMSQLLENVFADPRGFGIAPDGRYRCGAGGAACVLGAGGLGTPRARMARGMPRHARTLRRSMHSQPAPVMRPRPPRPAPQVRAAGLHHGHRPGVVSGGRRRLARGYWDTCDSH
jgi:hypothetical protein